MNSYLGDEPVASDEEPEKIEGEEASDDKPTQYDQITIGRIVVSALSVTDVKKPDEHRENTDEQPAPAPKRIWWHFHNWSWPTIWIFATAVGTMSLAAFAYLAWDEAIEGTRIARRQLVFGQRAFVNFDVAINRDIAEQLNGNNRNSVDEREPNAHLATEAGLFLHLDRAE